MNTEKVWFSGRRWIGPDKTFKKFSSSAHYIDLEDVSVFAKPDDVSLRYGFIIIDLFFNVMVETLNTCTLKIAGFFNLYLILWG